MQRQEKPPSYYTLQKAQRLSKLLARINRTSLLTEKEV